MTSFVDIHCHILPGLDDGARDWDESLAMAQLAVADGTSTIIATPHQLGGYGRNRRDAIRLRVGELKKHLADAGVHLMVLPGADVRVEDQLVEQLVSGTVLTLGDHGRHVLLELPHELYLPLEPLVERLARHDIVAILSHPERNEGILRRPHVLDPLIDAGCLLQITAGSLCGSFGEPCRRLAESLVARGVAHFVATDGHGAKARRPLMRRAYERVIELVGVEMAAALCCHNPALVAAGQPVPTRRGKTQGAQRSWWRGKSAA
ncbi:MAG TPA: CpsB/CapC family capsule biosynthesis tyrosine phosphatase [Lacipirellulaceae bacterium]|nr:CpsB/CapC family capsule biosynthesis tyrosine phosphatase [Lacipirellulaceae bacterium]